jgi:glycosyltransferase involved in cell wall biosynthesis
MDEVNAVRQAYNREKNSIDNTLESAKLADIVTVTTETLQAELAKIGINSIVIKNTIHPSSAQFSTYKNKSNRLRFGWVGGSFHRRDVALMYDGLRRLHGDPAEKGKYQILMSFNTTSEYIEQERVVTNNYTICTPAYRDYLKKYIREGGHVGNDETYKRLWNLGVMDYGAMYQQIDVALIPLQHGKFNSCKSELKLIEAGTTGCAAIVSDVEPYKKWLKHGYNCLTTEGTNGWYTAMKVLLNNPELRQEITNNLAKTISENFDTFKENNILATELNKIQCHVSE